MKASYEKTEGNTVRVDIKVEPGEVKEAVQQAYRKVVKDVRIPGFRKGKAPRPILERYVGTAALHQEAIEDLVPRAYADAVEELELEPIDHPEFDIVSFDEEEGFEFTAEVEVKPEVTLGDYKEIRVDYAEPEIGEEAVEAEVERLLSSAGQLVTVEDQDSPVEEGQYAVVNFEGYVDGESIDGGSAKEYVLEIGSGTFIKGFEEQLVGMVPGEQRNITVTFPEDYGEESLAGKEATFEVELLEIKKRELPELDDEFLQEIGPYESVEELRDDILDQLATQAKRDTDRDFRNDVVTAVIEKAELVVPEVLVEGRIDELLQDLRNQFSRQNFTLEAYLEQADQTIDDLRQEFRERAKRDVKADLVLEAVAEAEGIEAEPQDVEAELEAMGRMYGQPAEALRPMMLSGENGRQLRYNIKIQKTIEYLGEIAQGTDPDEAKEEATRKYRERLENVKGRPQPQQEAVPGGLQFGAEPSTEVRDETEQTTEDVNGEAVETEETNGSGA